MCSLLKKYLEKQNWISNQLNYCSILYNIYYLQILPGYVYILLEDFRKLFFFESPLV